MTCASCGKQIPAGSRYCIHCGAEQSPPTPIAAVAIMANASRAQAANAAHAEPRAVPAPDAANQPSAKDASRESPGAAPPRQTIALPAYASAPRRGGLAAGLIGGGVLVAVAFAAVVGWRMHESGANAVTERDEGDRPAATQRAAEPPVGAAPVTPPGGGTREPAASAMAPAAARDATDADASSAASTAAPAATSAATTTREPPIEIKPLPPRPALAHGARRAPAENRSPQPDAAAPAPASPSEPAPVDKAPATASAVRVPAVSSLSEHWRQMDDELSRCTRADFITRVICGQRVRFRYCDGYWGKVSQCPASPAPEHGQ